MKGYTDVQIHVSMVAQRTLVTQEAKHTSEIAHSHKIKENRGHASASVDA